jgi:hypothetical protein
MSKKPENLRHVRLELARESGHPDGDTGHGYDLVLPLGDDGRIDVPGFRAHKDLCRVRRFRPGEDDTIGKLVHGPGGRWSFDYDPQSDSDDEAGFRFGDERFAQGEYISVREDDGQDHTFVVTQVNRV